MGEGEITLGVAGIGFEEDRDMVKGGSEGIRMAPVTRRPKSATRKNHLLVERRCLSFREDRMFATLTGKGELELETGDGGFGGRIIGSSGLKGAEQNCAAWLREDMVALLRRFRGTNGKR